MSLALHAAAVLLENSFKQTFLFRFTLILTNNLTAGIDHRNIQRFSILLIIIQIDDQNEHTYHNMLHVVHPNGLLSILRDFALHKFLLRLRVFRTNFWGYFFGGGFFCDLF